MKRKIIYEITKILPLVLFLTLWECLTHNNKTATFYYGSPSEIVLSFWNKTLDGTLWYDTFITFSETVAGFLIGNIVGVTLGLLLWFSKPIFNLAKPYIIALGSAPIFALSPLLVIWFGIGVFAKIMIAAISTVFIALLQAYNGAENVENKYIEYFTAYQASKKTVFTKLILPSSLVWVISAFKLNIGFAMLGAFIGEYISSNAGLGHMIVINTGLFNIPNLMLAVIMMMLIALLLNYVIGIIEKPLKKVLSKL